MGRKALQAQGAISEWEAGDDLGTAVPDDEEIVSVTAGVRGDMLESAGFLDELPEEEEDSAVSGGKREKPEFRPDYSVCRLSFTENTIITLLTHIRKLILFVNQSAYLNGIKKKEIDMTNLPAALEKLHLLNWKFNPTVKVGRGEMSWWKFLSTCVQICFPNINGQTAGCDRLGFSHVVLNEIIIPLYGTKSVSTAKTWFVNTGDAVTEKMKAKMREIVKKREAKEEEKLQAEEGPEEL